MAQFADLQKKKKYVIMHVAVPIDDLGDEKGMDENTLQSDDSFLNEPIFNMSLEDIEHNSSSDEEDNRVTGEVVRQRPIGIVHHTPFLDAEKNEMGGGGAITATSHEEIVFANKVSGRSCPVGAMLDQMQMPVYGQSS